MVPPQNFPKSKREPMKTCPQCDTGYPDSQMLANILKMGPVTVLEKPLQVEHLNQTLKIMGHKQLAQAA